MYMRLITALAWKSNRQLCVCTLGKGRSFVGFLRVCRVSRLLTVGLYHKARLAMLM